MEQNIQQQEMNYCFSYLNFQQAEMSMVGVYAIMIDRQIRWKYIRQICNYTLIFKEIYAAWISTQRCVHTLAYINQDFLCPAYKQFNIKSCNQIKLIVYQWRTTTTTIIIIIIKIEFLNPNSRFFYQ